MGSQDEYLRNFTVLLTERGVVPLTDPMQILVYNCLQTGTKRPSDIAAELGVPSSSLHFVLDKMVEAGVVVRSKPDPEKKSVYYSNLAIKVAGSFTPDEVSKRIADETFRDPSRYYDGLSAVANMLESYTCEIGLDLDQVRNRYASAFADECSRSLPEGTLEDCIPAIREEFARVTGFKFSVYGLSPLSLVFEGDRTMAPKVDMLSRFVARSVENATGKHYEVVGLEDFSFEDSARIKVTFDRAEPREEPYLNLSLPKKEASRFMMVDLDGSAGLMTSDVQLDMIDAIYERPLCITDIVNCVNAPRSTITSNLLRMVEEGVITVFYSESGSAYYGLSCSILMKKVRNPTDDDMSGMLSEVAAKDGAFMEGYLLYTIGYFKALGFDTDYLMVVLGAKYMRAAGYGQPKNFDLFFGKMSDIARAIGLSMNVVSVYPLTIGISAEDPESSISTAMTFVKGMAHQGLEMASDGIFVRNMEGDDESSKISFKEIYPALSMTPVEGIRVENLAPAASTKRRTSSVKTALFNRSEKATGKPARTVRYITAFAVLAMVAAVLAFSMGGDSGSVADTFSVDIEDADCGLVFFDEFGNEIDVPSEVAVNSVLRFSVEEGTDIGYTESGLAYRLSPGGNGVYSVKVSSDLKLESLSEVSLPESVSVQIYNFADQISDKRAYTYRGYYTAEDYEAATGGLWVGANAVLRITADDGKYLSTSGDKADSVLWKTLLVRDPSMDGIEVKDMPSSTVVLSFNGDYAIDGNYVTGELEVIKGKTLNVTFGSAQATGTKIIVTYDTGSTKEIDVKDDGNTFRLFYCFKDMTIDYKLGDFSRAPLSPPEVRKCSAHTAGGPSRARTSATAPSAART